MESRKHKRAKLTNHLTRVVVALHTQSIMREIAKMMARKVTGDYPFFFHLADGRCRDISNLDRRSWETLKTYLIQQLTKTIENLHGQIKLGHETQAVVFLPIFFSLPGALLGK